MMPPMPIPAPPRTPTPPSPVIPDEPDAAGLGIDGLGHTVRSTITFDPNALSPMTDSFPSQFGSMQSPLRSAGLSSPAMSIINNNNNNDGGMAGRPQVGPRSPFNFQPQQYTNSATVAKSNIGQRRGHRYKHSSVSTQHQIFLEPPPRAPLAIPPSLPIPTFKEAWHSMSKEQQTRFGWCICHALVAAYVLYSAAGSLALTALSHLVFFDAISATICVVVDVFCNFEVWKRSSIRHPFGLERAEVLAGFAMSVFLLFMGFDLISHNLKHVLESLGSHKPHHPHSHQRISHGSVDPAAFLSIIATLTSAYALKNHARISKALRFSFISSLPSVLSNPSHFLTLSCSSIMLLLPLLSVTFYLWLDRLMCTIIAVSMFVLGIRLAIAQGLMLLMSYSGKGVSDVMREINNEPNVSGVDEARFWQVHYGLCMANLKLRVHGIDESALPKLRERINQMVKNRLGGGYGKGGSMRWEVTTQFEIET
ncbi:cation efflux family protein family [Phlyctema vagabunda]|uniref:Zinc transporter n=1 Tax=Phlyctema vagabunda TaxID=108571 RepID=A0ABR4PJC4_9HELO